VTGAFVILAHKRPAQVERLIERLRPHRVLLHVDSGVDGDDAPAFAAVAERTGATLLPRHRSAWASWGIVAAMLEGLRAALRHTDWSHVTVLSGQDYPLLPSADIDRFLGQHAGTSFMARWPLPSRLWGRDGGMHRLRFRHRPLRGRRVFLPLPRRLPRDVRPYGGSMYACLTRAAAGEVLRFAAARPDVVRFYRRAWIPDEMFVPTAVMNGPAGASVANESLSFIRWSDAGGRHPDVLRSDDIDALAAAAAGPSDVGGHGRRKLFARKLDEQVDGRLLDLIDERLLR
jgi:Core-2/I-Branching enzyme